MKIINKLKGCYYVYALALIIIIGIVRLLVLFSYRDGHHVDETWTYSFANSYYNTPVIDTADAEPDYYTGKWLTGSVFNDFLSVSEDHRFSFDAVMHNKRDDLSPALYALILHFVSSFFPGVFSWSFAFGINLFFYILTIALIYLISYEFTHDKFCGLICSLFYVFSGCCMGNFLYLRVYSLFTFLTLLTLWLFIRIIKSDKNTILLYFALAVTALLGSFTHYYYMVIAFFFTVFSIIVLLIGKKVKKSAILGFVMLGTELLYLFVYSPAMKVFLPFTGRRRSVTGGISFPYSMDLSSANIRFFNGSIGLYIPFSYAGCMYFIGILVFALITIFMILYLFRNENWMKKFKSLMKSGMKKSIAGIYEYMKTFDASLYIAILSSVGYLLIIPISANIINMGFVERYFFPAMTVFSIAFISVICKLFTYLNVKVPKKIITLPVLGVIALLLVFMDIRSNRFVEIFKFRDMYEDELKNVVSGKDCYVVVSTTSDLLWLSPILNESNNVYVDYQKNFDSDEPVIPSLSSDTIFLFVKTGMITDEEKAELLSDPEAYEIYVASYGNSKCPGEVLTMLDESTGYTFECTDDLNTFIGNVGIYIANS